MRLISVDVGTTNIKTALVEVSNNFIHVIKGYNIRVPPEKPEKGAYEHNPNLLTKLIVESMKHVSSPSVDAVVFSSYLFGLVALGRGMKPLTNIITWVDERSYAAVEDLKPHGKELYLRTGCPPLHIYALPKILWLKKKQKELIKEAEYFLDAKSFLMRIFTNEVVTDLASASGTYQLLNIHDLKWDDLALEIAGLDESKLPLLVEGSYIAEIKTEIAEALGIDERVPVVTGLYDGASMIYGLTLGRSGLGVINLGTSAMLRVVADHPVLDNPELMRFQTYYFINSKWLCGAGISNAGIIFDYLVRLLNISSTGSARVLYDEIFNNVDNRLEKESRCLLIPILYPERIPFIIPNWRVSILGLKPEIDNIDVIRAAVEGVTSMLKIVGEGLEENGIVFDEVRVGGKLAKYSAVQKVLANMLNKKVLYCELPDISHIGNALLTLRSLKVISDKSLEEILNNLINSCRLVSPDPRAVSKYAKVYAEFKKILKLLYT